VSIWRSTLCADAAGFADVAKVTGQSRRTDRSSRSPSPWVSSQRPSAMRADGRWCRASREASLCRAQTSPVSGAGRAVVKRSSPAWESPSVPVTYTRSPTRAPLRRSARRGSYGSRQRDADKEALLGRRRVTSDQADPVGIGGVHHAAVQSAESVSSNRSEEWRWQRA
jgi:hypothetical protein